MKCVKSMKHFRYSGNRDIQDDLEMILSVSFHRRKLNTHPSYPDMSSGGDSGIIIERIDIRAVFKLMASVW